VLVASVHFLTPLGALACLAALVPAVALIAAERRARLAARALALEPVPVRRLLPRTLLSIAVPVLLGLAAAQPVLETTRSLKVRKDAQAFFVVDVSRSMLAAGSADAEPRLERAKKLALDLRRAIPQVRSGIAGFTDRTLPYLFPTADARSFASTLRLSVSLEAPPPRQVAPVATSFAALGALGTGGFFPATISRRGCIVLTDGETAPYSSEDVARSLAMPRGCRLLIVHVWRPDERVFAVGGRPEPQYRPDAAARSTIAGLAAATGGTAVDEGDLGTARAALRTIFGRGPTTRVSTVRHTRALGPGLALAAVAVTVLLVLGRLATFALQRETPAFYDAGLRA
jgi:hypothetical protein